MCRRVGVILRVMILSPSVLAGIADGTITLVIRRWERPNVRAGDILRTALGVVSVRSVSVVESASITDADALAAGMASGADVLATLRGSDRHLVYRIEVAAAGPDPRIALRAVDELSDADVREIARRLGNLDRHSTHGPWTGETLALIVARPGERARDLAAALGRKRDPFKIDVRKLKNLGLTESLEVGYRISPRGSAYLAVIGDQDASAPG